MAELTSAQKEFLIKKHEHTMQLRAEFIKQTTNPHRTGDVFDSGLTRFHAMRVTGYDHFKFTGHTFKMGMCTVVLPIILLAWAFKTERDSREAKYRTGQVAYKDRKFKFI